MGISFCDGGLKLGFDTSGFDFPLRILTQNPLQDLPAWVTRDCTNKLHTSGKRFVFRKTCEHELLNIILRKMRACFPGSSNDIRAWELCIRIWERDPYDCCIHNLGMREEYSFEFWWCHLEATNFNQLFSSVHNVPLSGTLVAIGNISCLEPAIRVK